MKKYLKTFLIYDYSYKNKKRKNKYENNIALIIKLNHSMKIMIKENSIYFRYHLLFVVGNF